MRSSDLNSRDFFEYMKDSIADEVVNLSDEEISAELAEISLSIKDASSEFENVYKKSKLASGKRLLQLAKDEIENNRNVEKFNVRDLAPREARDIYKKVVLENQATMTLAARNESSLSDEDIYSNLEDFIELGLMKRDG